MELKSESKLKKVLETAVSTVKRLSNNKSRNKSREQSKRSSPRLSNPRPSKSLKEYQRIWIICTALLPVDLLISEQLGQGFQRLTLLLPPQLQMAPMILALIMIACLLFKNQLLSFILGAQGVQGEARGLRIQFQSLFSTVLAILIWIDIIRRVAEFQQYIALALFVSGILIFPTWYRHVKRNEQQDSRQIAYQANDAALLVHSIHQFDLAFQAILIIGRTGILLLVASVSQTPSSHLWTLLATICGFFVLLSARPTLLDLLRVCRKCGLWSHRAHQVDGFCPGCSQLALKSERYRTKSSRLSRIQSLLNTIEQRLVKPRS